MEPHTISVKVGGKEISFETGKIARQANGAVLVRQGETFVFGTACSSPEPLEDVDFIPLRVDYQERLSSTGKTLSGYIKREGRPSEHEILVSRLIDRPIRPMFEEGYQHEIQLLATVWSFDGNNTPDVLGICAASAALVISDIPLVKPIGAVRVGLIEGNFVINPTTPEMVHSKLDLVLAGTHDAILMIEGYCDFLTEEQIIEAIDLGHKAIAQICDCQAKFQKMAGKAKKRDTLRALPLEAVKAVQKLSLPDLKEKLRIIDKKQREAGVAAIKEKVLAGLFPAGEEPKFSKADVAAAFKKVQSDIMRLTVLDEQIRCDGRKPTDIRQITIEQSLLPRTHGSSLFTRGETQAVAVCTLGGENSSVRYQTLTGEGTRRFYLQYFFPPYSVGEVGRMGAPGRREVGHGKLAERALQTILPDQESFPYTIRIESNITESNGSSSMASVCGGCLAMMDAGVPIKRPVAGIAMGLILEGDRTCILSDILGVEDSLGDMDFKVTGDHEGVTAFQMDIKVEGITLEIMRQALAQAKEGRRHILEKMLAVCPRPKTQMSAYAPRIETIRIKPSKIGIVVGPGGKQIRAIIEQTGVEIDINDDGLVSISSQDPEGMEKAKAIIRGLTEDVEIGKTYHGKVTSVTAFGAFVEIVPGKEGLCHISELDRERVNDIFAFIKPGDQVDVKVLDINERGQLKLSRKALL